MEGTGAVSPLKLALAYCCFSESCEIIQASKDNYWRGQPPGVGGEKASQGVIAAAWKEARGHGDVYSLEAAIRGKPGGRLLTLGTKGFSKACFCFLNFINPACTEPWVLPR